MTKTVRFLVVLVLAGLFCFSQAWLVAAKDFPEPGDQMPEVLNFAFPVPEQSQGGFGVRIPAGQKTFTLPDLDREYFLLEVVGVYCPVCHTQAPDMVRLHQRIQRDAKLSSKVVVLAVAAGATPMEVEHLQKNWRFPFPILQDGDYSLHKLLGEPDTPFTVLIDQNGTIHYAQLGRIDVADFFTQMKHVMR